METPASRRIGSRLFDTFHTVGNLQLEENLASILSPLPGGGNTTARKKNASKLPGGVKTLEESLQEYLIQSAQRREDLLGKSSSACKTKINNDNVKQEADATPRIRTRRRAQRFFVEPSPATQVVDSASCKKEEVGSSSNILTTIKQEPDESLTPKQDKRHNSALPTKRELGISSNILTTIKQEPKESIIPKTEPSEDGVRESISGVHHFKRLDDRFVTTRKKPRTKGEVTDRIRRTPLKVEQDDDCGSTAPKCALQTDNIKVEVESPPTADDTEADFERLLENLRYRKRKDDRYDETQVDLNRTLADFETTNLDERRFLISLDEDAVPLESCHRDALPYRTEDFKLTRVDLAKKLYDLYHRTIFQNRFEKDIPIDWSDSLLAIAGCCLSAEHPVGNKLCFIQLSTKLIDRAVRLRDTLLHEMCHAASWLIHGYRDGHGVLFQFWGQRAFELYGLTVTRCHTYEMDKSRCRSCGKEVFSRAVHPPPSAIICKRCANTLRPMFWRTRVGRPLALVEEKSCVYSDFLKTAHKEIIAENPQMEHQQVMSAIRERWRNIINKAKNRS